MRISCAPSSSSFLDRSASTTLAAIGLAPILNPASNACTRCWPIAAASSAGWPAASPPRRSERRRALLLVDRVFRCGPELSGLALATAAGSRYRSTRRRCSRLAWPSPISARTIPHGPDATATRIINCRRARRIMESPHRRGCRGASADDGRKSSATHHEGGRLHPGEAIGRGFIINMMFLRRQKARERTKRQGYKRGAGL